VGRTMLETQRLSVVRFTSVRWLFILLPLLRRVLLRMASFSLPGSSDAAIVFPLSKGYPRVEPSSLLASTHRVLWRGAFAVRLFYPLADLVLNSGCLVPARTRTTWYTPGVSP